jgi:hypothetical protein
VNLRSEFRVVISVTISAYKRCSVRLYLQLFVEGLMSYLRYLCLLAYSGVNIYSLVRGYSHARVFYMRVKIHPLHTTG